MTLLTRQQDFKSATWPLHLRFGLFCGLLLLLLVVCHATATICWSGPWCQPVQGAIDQYGYLFELSGEMNIPSWFSVILLFLVAACAAIIGYSAPAGRRPWFWLAGLFIYMSVDEIAELHGLWPVILHMEQTQDAHLNHFLWVIPGAVLVLLIAAVFLRWVLKLPKRTRNYFILAGIVFVSGGLGLEIVGSVVADPTFFNPVYLVVSTLEETLEMAGVIIMVMGLLAHGQTIGLRLETDRSTTP